MAQLLGTVLASPVVQGNSDIDSYGTHYSFLGVGGYQEYATLAERDGLLINPSNQLGLDGLSSGRRRFGMLVYVAETDIVYQLKPVYSTWSGLTNTQKVAELANNNNWVEFSSGGGGDAIKKKYNQTSHGFSVGEVVAFNGTNFVKKLSSSGNEDETLGMVSLVNDTNNFTITYAGFIDISSMTGLSANTVYYSSAVVAGGITATPPSGLGEENRPILITQTTTTGIVVQYRGFIITESEITGGTGTTVTGVIGPAEDGTYTDGLFTDFIPTTPIGTAVDRFNEILKALSPLPAPDLLNIGQSILLNSGKLSFGNSKSISGYNNVTVLAGNSAVDINESYLQSGTRLGISDGVISGVLNNNVTGTTSYPTGAFGDANIGTLEMYVNGVLVGTPLNLSSTTGATGNSRFSVSALSPVISSNGQPLPLFNFRTGFFGVPTGDSVNGFNYMRILHVKPSETIETNYVEWVYDPDSSSLSVGSTSLSGLILTGSKFISGVRYSTGGTITYNATISNAYKNVYPNGNAISYPTRVNLSDSTIISKTGTGLTSDISAAKTFPALNTGVTNPQLTTLVLASTHTLQNNILGSVGTLGRVETNVSIVHPIKTTLTGGATSSTGFLHYPTVASNNLKTENFTGEVQRIQNNNYTSLTYANIDGGTYVWTGSESLVGANPTHNTGLLIFNGELMYPNAPYLLSTYGINAGNFSGLPASNVLPGNPNYSTASGIRIFNRKFKSTNTTTQSTLTIEFLHTGSNSSFLTNGGTGGTPTGNFIKVECMIKRVGGATHGYFNPFASIGNPEGIANTAISTIGGGTSVTCTLSTVPRIGNGDIVIVRVLAAAGWTNRISNINIVNI